MSRVKRKWRMGEKPVNLRFAHAPSGGSRVRFECPQCGDTNDQRLRGEVLWVWCPCGARFRMPPVRTLEELEMEEDKGE